MAPKARFTDGEKVLCFHGPLLYEAKCLGSQIKDKHMKYFIHYNGWNKNWDEWVPECRVLKYNEANLQKQKELEKTHMKTKKPKGSKSYVKKDSEKEKEPTPPVIEKPKQTKQEKRPASAISEPSSSPVEIKKPKIKAEPVFVDEVEVDLKLSMCPTSQQNEVVDEIDTSNQEIKEEPKMETEIKFHIPPSLKCWLVDDCDLINHQKKLLHLPARVTVDHIIASYVKEKVSVKGLSSNMEITIVQIANRIRDCFNVLLGKSLLYKFERPQYKEMLSEHLGLRMCEIYGAIHLLRMFTTLGDMLQSITESGKVMSTLVGHIEDFIKYMAANPSFFSLDDYEVASPEYHRRALT